MAPISRRSQSSGLKSQRHQSFDRSSNDPESPLRLTSYAHDDALQPLRTMADRVGKEVEKFAERVDHWYTHGNETATAKYHTTLRLVSKFKDHADATVEALKKQNAIENRGELAKDVQRRIQSLAGTPRRSVEDEDEESDLDSTVIPESISLTVQDLRHWQSEAATWDLLRIIIELYYPAPGVTLEAARKKGSAENKNIYRYTPEIEIWERFILEDDKAKEKQMILKWLEKAADTNESDIQSITEQLESESGKGTSTWSSGWLDTRAKIKQEKRLRQLDYPLGVDMPPIKNSDKTQLLATQLDPDAPFRQRRTLEKSDDYYERAIWMACYEMLRRGIPWKEICEWCKERNEGWRGLSMGAAYEHQGDALTCLSGPNVGGLWRRMCFALARGSTYRYESAVYGLLSGDLASVEAVCRTWDDHLYARYNSLLLSRFDAYLQENYPQRLPSTLTRKFALFNSVEFHGDWENTNRRVIDLLKETKSISAQSKSPMKLIQGSLISRTFEDLVYNLGIALSQMAFSEEFTSTLILPVDEATEEFYKRIGEDPHALRIVVHMLLIFEVLGLENVHGIRGHIFENVTVGYIDFLRMARKMDLIPLYAAQLSPLRRANTLGRILPDIRNPAEQKQFLKLMQEYDIEVVDALGEYYEVVLGKSSLGDEKKSIKKYEILEPTDGELWPGQRIKDDFVDLDITPDEAAIIQSVEWYLHLEDHMSTTFVAMTDAMKVFLLNGRIGAALELCTVMSIEIVSRAKTPFYFDDQIFNIMEWDGMEELVNPELRRSIRSNSRRGSAPLSKQSLEKRRAKLLKYKEQCRTYNEFQQLVQAIKLLSQWRSEEDALIKARDSGSKAATKNIKDLFEQINTAMEPLLNDFLTHGFDGNRATPAHLTSLDTKRRALADGELAQLTKIRTAYLPEIVLAYHSVVQACAFFVSRDIMTKSMDLATVVASETNAELADAFVKTGRMEELVRAFATSSKTMIAMSQTGDKPRVSKKRGWKGESIKIWDVNVRN